MPKTQAILHWPRPYLQDSRAVALILMLLALTLLMLSGCETLPSGGQDADTRYVETRAKRMVRAGQHEQAAELYEQLASTATSADRFWLAAARQRYIAGQWPEVVRDLANIGGPLDPEESVERALLGAAASLSLNDIQAAETWLSEVPGSVSDRTRVSLLWLKTRLALARGNVNEAIELTAERELWLSRSEDVLQGRKALLEAMQVQYRQNSLPDAQDSDDPLTAGWLSLARILAEADRDPFVVRSALRDWQQSYPGHPAAIVLPELVTEYQRMLDYPQQLAVLLPLSGRRQAAGNAVRDGLMTAYLHHAEERPGLRFYDVDEQDIIAVYNQAVLDGADLVIGPLTRDAVSALAEAAPLPVPTLALNNLPADLQGVPGLYQFGLTPEDEARQAARRLLDDGLVQGIALTPANEWGQRMLEAFTNELELAGGILLDYQNYPPRDEDFSAAITAVLHLAESRARYRSLADILGRRIEFEPRRRQDVQFIFLAGTAETGRLMRPQLRFHYASSLPVYATSAIYEPAPGLNGDLNGVMFDDIPWMIDSNPELVSLREELSKLWPEGMRAWPRLYALGFDAYRLVPALFSGQLMEEATVQGLTGGLSLGSDGQIHRQLIWAKFEGGMPTPLEQPGMVRPPAPGSLP